MQLPVLDKSTALPFMWRCQLMEDRSPGSIGEKKSATCGDCFDALPQGCDQISCSTSTWPYTLSAGCSSLLASFPCSANDERRLGSSARAFAQGVVLFLEACRGRQLCLGGPHQTAAEISSKCLGEIEGDQGGTEGTPCDLSTVAPSCRRTAHRKAQMIHIEREIVEKAKQCNFYCVAVAHAMCIARQEHEDEQKEMKQDSKTDFCRRMPPSHKGQDHRSQEQAGSQAELVARCNLLAVLSVQCMCFLT